MADKFEQYRQEDSEKVSIDDRIAAALAAEKIIRDEGPKPHLPEDFPKSALNMAASSLARMRIRQETHGLDSGPVERSTQKLRAASKLIHKTHKP